MNTSIKTDSPRGSMSISLRRSQGSSGSMTIYASAPGTKFGKVSVQVPSTRCRACSIRPDAIISSGSEKPRHGWVSSSRYSCSTCWKTPSNTAPRRHRLASGPASLKSGHDWQTIAPGSRRQQPFPSEACVSVAPADTFPRRDRTRCMTRACP